MATIAGSAEVSVNGRKYPIEGDVTCRANTAKRTKLLGTGGDVQGTKEEWEAPYVKCSVRITPDIDPENDILNIVDAQVNVVLPDGRIFILDGSDFTGDGEYSTGEGVMALEFEGTYGDYVAQ